MSWFNGKIKFQFLWLLLIGGALEAYDAYSTGFNIFRQIKDAVESSQVKDDLETVGEGFQRISAELVPISVGLILAWLSPIIGIFEYLKIKRADLTTTEQRKHLIVARFKSLIIVSPVLVVVGLLVSLSAYIESASQTLSDVLRFDVFPVPIFKGAVFGAILATVGVIQIIQFFKRSNLTVIILITLVVIILNSLAVLLLDFGLSKLL